MCLGSGMITKKRNYKNLIKIYLENELVEWMWILITYMTAILLPEIIQKIKNEK